MHTHKHTYMFSHMHTHPYSKKSKSFLTSAKPVYWFVKKKAVMTGSIDSHKNVG